MLTTPTTITSQTPLETLIDSYLAYYASGSNHTARGKRQDIQKFLEFLSKHKKIEKVEELKVSHWDHSATQQFVENCLSRGYSPATTGRRLATLKHLGRTLAEKIAGFTNPAREVKTPTQKVTKPKSLTEIEVIAIKQKAENLVAQKSSKKKKNDFKSIRNRMIALFLLDTGLRADEVRLMKLSQINDELEWVENVRTKGKKYRKVYLTSAIREDFKIYLNERESELKRFVNNLTLAKSKLLPLFISTHKVDITKPETFFLSPKTIWRAIHNLSEQTKLHPHLLRHTFATELLDNSGDIRLVAQALGHSDVRVTMRYTERSDEEMAKALEKARENKPLSKLDFVARAKRFCQGETKE